MEQGKNTQSKKLTMVQNRITAAYLRVSTKKQEKEGVSIEAQEKYAKEYAAANDLVLKDEYIFEEAKPASKINDNKYNLDSSVKKRPVLNRLLLLAEQKKFHHLIIYSRDRLTRNVEEYFALKCLFNKYNIKIHYSNPSQNINVGEDKNGEDDQKDKNNYIEKLIEVILSSVAELEANLISSRVTLGNQHCINEKVWSGGKIPFGYGSETIKLPDHKRKNSKLFTIPYEKEIVNEIFKYYTNYGFSYRKLAEIMNEKYPFKTWTKSSIETILKNEIYTGHLIWGRRGGRRNPGKRDSYKRSPPIDEIQVIDQSLWERANHLMLNKSKIKDHKYYSTPFLLRDKLYCNVCKTYLTCKNNGKNKKSVYRCPGTAEGTKCGLILEKSFIEETFINKLSHMIRIEDTEKLWHLYADRQEMKKSDIHGAMNDYTQNIATLQQQLEQIQDALNKNIDYDIRLELMQLEVFIQKKVDIFKNINTCKNDTLNKLHSSEDQFKASLHHFFENFNQLSIYNKRMIIDLIVDEVIVDIHKDTCEMDIILNPPKLAL